MYLPSAEETSPVDTTSARLELLITPAVTWGMVSKTPRTADQLDPRKPNRRADRKATPPLEDKRRKPRFLAYNNKKYPKLVAFHDKGPFDVLEVSGQTPWFEMDAVIDWNFIPRFAHEGFIPGGIPLRAMETDSWTTQY